MPIWPEKRTNRRSRAEAESKPAEEVSSTLCKTAGEQTGGGSVVHILHRTNRLRANRRRKCRPHSAQNKPPESKLAEEVSSTKSSLLSIYSINYSHRGGARRPLVRPHRQRRCIGRAHVSSRPKHVPVRGRSGKAQTHSFTVGLSSIPVPPTRPTYSRPIHTAPVLTSSVHVSATLPCSV